MTKSPIIYERRCSICNNVFRAVRVHAVTCSSRCRYISYILRRNCENYSISHRVNLFELTPEEMLAKRDFLRNNLKDENGNVKDFVKGYKEINGNLKIIVFRIDTLKLLEVWIDKGEKIMECFYRY